MEEGDYTIGDALMVSLAKIREQRELISEIQGKKEVEFNTYEPIVHEPVIEIEKAGRVLSKKTRSIMSKAIESMKAVADALNELMDSTDAKLSEDEEIVEIEEKIVDEVLNIVEVEENPVEQIKMFMDFDENKLRSAIADTLSGILRDQSKLSAGDIVKERLDLAKGRIS